MAQVMANELEAKWAERPKEELLAALAEAYAALEQSKRLDPATCERDSLIDREAFRFLFEAMPLGVVFQDKEGAIVDANPSAEQILGLSFEQLMGRSSMDPRWRALGEDGKELPGEKHPAMQALRTGKPVLNTVMGVYNPDLDAVSWINASASPLFRPGESEPYLVFTVFLDITARRRSEQEARAQALFPSQNPHPVLRVSKQGDVLYANQASQELLEHMAAPGDNAAPPSYLEQVDAAFATGQLVLFELAAGAKIYLLSVAPFIEDGYCNIYGTDITVQKQTQLALKKERDFIDSVIQMAGSLVLVLDREGGIQRFNQACEARTGYSFDEVKGRAFWDLLLLPEEAELVQGVFKELLGGLFPNRHRNFWLTKSGERILIDWSNTALLDENGQVEFVIGTGLDITQQWEAQQAEAREIDALQVFSGAAKSSVTAATLGLQTLRQARPDAFESLCARFAQLMDLALERLTMKVEHDVSRGIYEIGEMLGRLRAGPRDATEIYLQSLKNKCSATTKSRCQAFREEGRMLYIELLGVLTGYYRSHCLGVAPTAFNALNSPSAPSADGAPMEGRE